MAPHERRAPRSAQTRLLASAAVGLAVGLTVGLLAGADLGALAGWDTTVATYVGTLWLAVWPLDADGTRRRSKSQDPTHATADAILLSAAVASLAAVGLVLANASHKSGSAELVRVGLALGSVVLSWAVVHTTFTLRYAHLYYDDPEGGVDFKQTAPPAYSDFAYLAFTIGMTFQVSDTDLRSSEIRRAALRHGLLSYLFGTGIVATTINLVANLTNR